MKRYFRFYDRFRMLSRGRPLAGTYANLSTVVRKCQRMNEYSRAKGCGNRYTVQGYLKVEGTRRVWWG